MHSSDVWHQTLDSVHRKLLDILYLADLWIMITLAIQLYKISISIQKWRKKLSFINHINEFSPWPGEMKG